MIGIDFFWFGLFVLLNGLLLLGLAINISRLRMTRKIPYGFRLAACLDASVSAKPSGCPYRVKASQRPVGELKGRRRRYRDYR